MVEIDTFIGTNGLTDTFIRTGELECLKMSRQVKFGGLFGKRAIKAVAASELGAAVYKGVPGLKGLAAPVCGNLGYA